MDNLYKWGQPRKWKTKQKKKTKKTKKKYPQTLSPSHAIQIFWKSNYYFDSQYRWRDIRDIKIKFLMII